MQQHLLHQRPAGQADMDVHLRRLLRHHGVHPLLPQLPDLVLPGARHDHLHRVVPRHRRAHKRPGEPPTSIPSTGESAIPTHAQARWVLSAFGYLPMIDHRRRRRPTRAGRGRRAHRPDQARALLHRRHQHPLHLRRPRRHSVSPSAGCQVFSSFPSRNGRIQVKLAARTYYAPILHFSRMLVN